jgi:hypothetical protein
MDNTAQACTVAEIDAIIKSAMDEILFICQLDTVTMHASGEGNSNDTIRNDIDKLKTIALKNTEDLLIHKLSEYL